jgi:hypothetical protein
MAVGGQDFVVLAEIFVDRFGLRGRLDDDKFHAGYLSKGASDGRVGEANVKAGCVSAVFPVGDVRRACRTAQKAADSRLQQ